MQKNYDMLPNSHLEIFLGANEMEQHQKAEAIKRAAITAIFYNPQITEVIDSDSELQALQEIYLEANHISIMTE